MKLFSALYLYLLVFAQAAQAQTLERFTLGELLQEERFEATKNWEEVKDTTSDVLAGVLDGAYVVSVDATGYMLGLDSVAYDDTIIDADANLMTADPLGQYGIACRIDPTTRNGYLFVITADGVYDIVRADDDGPTRLRYGRLERSAGLVDTRLRAVCVDDYLAFYVNDQLVAEARDSAYRQGMTAMVASAVPAVAPPVTASFDNVVIHEALPGTGLDAPLLALGERFVTQGDLLLEETFDSYEVWEQFDMGSVYMRIEDGSYRATSSDPDYLWAQNTLVNDDVIIEVSAATLSDKVAGEYGVMCRADEANTGLGYYFLISSDGHYMIAYRVGEGIYALAGGVVNQVIVAMVEPNRIRAVCIGDYLALYVNDVMLAQVTDTTYSSGVTGLAIQSPDEVTDVIFDNLTIHQAALAD